MVTGVKRGLVLILTMIIGWVFLFPGCQADVFSGDEEFNLTQAAEEINLPTPPEKITIPKLPEVIIPANDSAALISGTGNLSRLIEINNTQGDYAFGLLQIEGDDSTRWEYLIESSNKSPCYVTGYVSVYDATKFLFQSHAVSPDQHFSYAGVGLQEGAWTDAGRYSGEITIATSSSQNSTTSWVSGKNETGTISHLCRSYEVIDENGSMPSEPRIEPGLEWNPQGNTTTILPTTFFYRQYAGSFCEINHGLIEQSSAYSTTSGTMAQSAQDLINGQGKSVSMNTRGEEWPPGDLHSAGNSTFEEWRGDNVMSVNHYGLAWYGRNAGTAYGNTKGTAELIDFRVNPEADKRKSELISGFAGGRILGNAQQKQTGRVTIPASFQGYLAGTQVNNQCIISEKYDLSGTYVQRDISGDFETSGKTEKTGIFGNMTAGRENGTTSASRLTGVSSLLINYPKSGEISVNGRWMADAQEGLPVIRNIEATTPGKTAYSTSQTFSGMKYIKEIGIYKNGFVDVQ